VAYGQVGRTVVDELIKLGLPFVLIEMNESIVKELLREGLKCNSR
jgi:Trk K+ transport system NAD-binding subunit